MDNRTLIAALVALLALIGGGAAYVLSETQRVQDEGDGVRRMANRAQADAERALRNPPPGFE